MNLLEELKRRHVYRVAVAYVIVGWLLIQVVTQVFPVFAFPNWVEQLVVILVLIGFPIALLLAWAFDVTPGGVIRTDDAREADAPALSARRSRRAGLAVGLVGVLVAVIAGAAWWQFERGRAVAAPHAAAVSAQSPAVSPAVAVSTGALVSMPRAVPASVAVAQPIPAKSVAVLPFESLSTDKNNAYFADGMQDLILTKLADIGDLKVIARTSTLQYGSHPQNLTLVGKQLGVATILEGSVQKSGNQVLINVQLIDVKTDAHIWAESYQRTLSNIFGVEGEVAEKVAEALNAKLTAEETAAVNRIPTTNPQAYTLYLKAQHEISMMASATGDTRDTLVRKAAGDLRQAIALDPNFAAAYGNLAFLELITTPGKRISTQPWMTHARKALSLQPDSPMALLAIGRWQVHNGKAGLGLQALQKAARLAPGNAFVVGTLSLFYQLTGAWQQADAAARQAARVDPRNATNYLNAAHASLALHHYADAHQLLERGLAVSPDNAYLHAAMGEALVLLGDFAGARAQYAQLPAASNFGKFDRLAHAWLLSRNCTEAIKSARRMPSPPRVVRATGFRETDIGRCELILGDQAGGRATLAQARAAIQAVLYKHPHTIHELGDQANLQNRLAYIEAWLGHRDAALQAIGAAIALETRQYAELWKRWGLPQTSKGLRMFTAHYYEDKAEILAHFGDAKGASDILGRLLPAPGILNVVSPALLRLAPVWDPIRHDPAFQSLLKKYGGATPADTQSASGSTTLTKGKR